MTKARVYVVHLHYGGYLGPDMIKVTSREKATTFIWTDAWRFLRDTSGLYSRHSRYNNPLWGASVEALRKRGRHRSPVTADVIADMLRRLEYSRVIAEAERCEREAESSLKAAAYAHNRAAECRTRAAEFRRQAVGG